MKIKNIGLVIAAMILSIGIVMWQQSRYQQTLSEEVLRFHVLANSDSETDQELKKRVRDAIGTYMGKKLDNVQSLPDCEAVVEKELDEIEAIGENVVVEQGYDYKVHVAIETVEFPEKSYGDYTFPAGTYRALRVIIGEGEGHNWWCVMYPNMCFSDSVYEVVEEDAKVHLQEILTVTQYRELIESKDKKVMFRFLQKDGRME